MQKIFFNKIIKLSKKEFILADKKKILNHILKGNIIIVKKSVELIKLKSICKLLEKKNVKPAKSTKMLEGIKNIFYAAEPKKIIKEKEYKVLNKSWYFFPWNKDNTGLVKLVQPLFDNVLKINGFDPNKIKRKTPKDGIVQRFHLMHYPLGSGYISRHVDPSHITKATAGIYITQFGKDYSNGGFYVINKNKKKINIDKFIKSSDMVLFYSSMPHGVDIVTAKKINYKNFLSGRWFLNLTVVASHHNKNRVTSRGY